MTLANGDTKVVDYTGLKALNAKAVKRNYNRSFVWAKLDKVISKEHFFPIKQWMVHDYANEEAVRCQVVLNHKGDTGWLDIALSTWNLLPSAESLLEGESEDE